MIEITGKVALLVFDSTNTALKAERVLKAAGVPTTVIPTPQEITAECGIALLVSGKRIEAAVLAMDAAAEGTYRLVFPFERSGGSLGLGGGR